MTTLADLHSTSAFEAISIDSIRDVIGDFKVRGKAVDVANEAGDKLVNRIGWLVNRIGRVLDVTGKLDPAKTTFKIDRCEKNILHVRFLDLEGNLQYRLDFGTAEDPGYTLCDSKDEVLVSDKKWIAISRFFAPEKTIEKTVTKNQKKTAAKDEAIPVKAAATPKKKAKRVATKPAAKITAVAETSEG